MTTYSAFDISCYIVNKCINDKSPISNLQLQKILYFVQLGYLKDTGSILFEDDFVAWRYGPVIPEIYRLFSIWGGSKITSLINTEFAQISKEDEMIISPIIEDKRSKRPWILVEEAHSIGSPWEKTWNNKSGDGCVINKRLIIEAAR